MNEEQTTKTNEIQTENIVKKILTSEVKYLIGIVLFIFGVVTPYNQIKTDIELIKQNHLAHIETMQRDIESQQKELNDIKVTEVKLMEAIAKQSAQIDAYLKK
jgi:hypothetical protein